MLRTEKPYDFKKELLAVHKKNIRKEGVKPTAEEVEILSGLYIVLPKDSDAVMLHAARDFSDYLFTSMRISSMLTYEAKDGVPQLRVSKNQEIGEASGYMGYSITVEENGITLEGYDSRGVAQGFYHLEDVMNIKKAPILPKGNVKRKALFSPRFSQSPFGMFEYTDEALSLMAHRGYDAIELWIRDLNVDNRGAFIDMILLVERAEKFGIDVYIELYAPHAKHPEEEGHRNFMTNSTEKFSVPAPKLKGLP